jgi:hypothetical protein
MTMASSKAQQPRKRKKGESFHTDRATPAETYVRNLPGVNYLLSEVAEIVGLNSHTIRRLIKANPPRVKAPSYVGQLGKQQIYIFTEEDVEEIRSYYARKYELMGKPGPKR